MDEDVLWKHQSTLITKLFDIYDVNDFIWGKNNDQWVPTWDNKVRVCISKEQAISVHKEASILGPLAAMFGRELQQFLMQNPKATLIKQQDIQYSVDSGRTAIKVTSKPEYANWGAEDDNASQSSKRTRSPRRAWYRGGQEVDLRASDQHSHGY